MSDNPRRLMLRLGVKLLTLLSIGLFAYVLLSSIEEPQPEKPPQAATLRLELPPVDEVSVTRHAWSGGNLILLRYPSAMHPSAPPAERLRDPLSRQAQQPSGLSPSGRSRQEGLFLAYDRGTDMGCPLRWVGAGSRDTPLTPWPGGFRDTCRGSWYDAAGRVFADQEARENLAIPPYRLIAPDLLEVGVNGDNPASEK